MKGLQERIGQGDLQWTKWRCFCPCTNWEEAVNLAVPRERRTLSRPQRSTVSRLARRMTANRSTKNLECRRRVILAPDHAQRDGRRFWSEPPQYDVRRVAPKVLRNDGHADPGGN